MILGIDTESVSAKLTSHYESLGWTLVQFDDAMNAAMAKLENTINDAVAHEFDDASMLAQLNASIELKAIRVARGRRHGFSS